MGNREKSKEARRNPIKDRKREISEINPQYDPDDLREKKDNFQRVQPVWLYRNTSYVIVGNTKGNPSEIKMIRIYVGDKSTQEKYTDVVSHGGGRRPSIQSNNRRT